MTARPTYDELRPRALEMASRYWPCTPLREGVNEAMLALVADLMAAFAVLEMERRS